MPTGPVCDIAGGASTGAYPRLSELSVVLSQCLTVSLTLRKV